MAKYPEVTQALHDWSRWVAKLMDGRELWTPESILAVMMQYGVVPDGNFGSRELVRGSINPEPVRTHAVIVKMARHQPELARVLVCHYVLPGDVKDKRRTYFSKSQAWYDSTLAAAKAWLEGHNVGSRAN